MIKRIILSHISFYQDRWIVGRRFGFAINFEERRLELLVGKYILGVELL